MTLPRLADPCRNPTCGHSYEVHLHYTDRTHCGICNCPSFHGPINWALVAVAVLSCAIVAAVIFGIYRLLQGLW